jgi:hypothetical protein
MRARQRISNSGLPVVPVHNADVGSIFEDSADLEIQSSNPFRVRACRTGEHRSDLKALIDKGEAPTWKAGSGRSAPGGTCEVTARPEER